MKKQYLGIALMVIGVALAVWGYNIYESASSQITRALSGDTPVEAWVGMVGGAIAFIVGALNLRK